MKASATRFGCRAMRAVQPGVSIISEAWRGGGGRGGRTRKRRGRREEEGKEGGRRGEGKGKEGKEGGEINRREEPGRKVKRNKVARK